MWSSLRRRARRLLRRRVYPALEALWAAGFALAGCVWRRRSLPCGSRFEKPKLVLSAARGSTIHNPQYGSGQRVGILAPHPDDEAAGCGGVAVLHHATGARVAVLVLSDGGASRAAGLPPAALIACRAAEARAAAATLGVDALALAGLPEGAWTVAEGAAVIARWLAAERPTLLYAPSCVDYHPEHLRAAQALARALRSVPPAAWPVVRVFAVFVPLGPDLVNCVAALGPAQAAKAHALACYRSQAAGLAQVRRRDRYLARFYDLPGAAEGFCELPAAAYRALLASGTWAGRRAPYRGLRPRPFTDPLAYIRGAGARRRLCQALEEPGWSGPLR